MIIYKEDPVYLKGNKDSYGGGRSLSSWTGDEDVVTGNNGGAVGCVCPLVSAEVVDGDIISTLVDCCTGRCGPEEGGPAQHKTWHRRHTNKHNKNKRSSPRISTTAPMVTLVPSPELCLLPPATIDEHYFFHISLKNY